MNILEFLNNCYVAALDLLELVIVDGIVAAVQVALAAPPPTKGYRNSIAFNASWENAFMV